MYIIVFLKYNIFFLYFQEKYFKLFCKKVKRYIMYREVIIKKQFYFRYYIVVYLNLNLIVYVYFGERKCLYISV